MDKCKYKSDILTLFEEYIKTDIIDKDKIERMGYEAYDGTHIAYASANIEELKDEFIKDYFTINPFSKEDYEKISTFFKILKTYISIGYTKHCVEESESTEDLLYSEDILPEFLKPSSIFKDAITNDFLSFNETPSVELDPKACPVFNEIEKAIIPENAKYHIHKVHDRLHYAARYFYELIKEKRYYELYGIFWRMRYLNILIVTAIALYELKRQKEFYEVFLEGHRIPMLIVSMDGQIANANKAALEFYGYTKDEITKLHSWDINTLNEEQMRKLISKAKNKEVNRFKFKHKLKSGEIRDVEVFSSPVMIEGEEYLLSTILDITQEEKTNKLLNILRDLEHISNNATSEGEFLERLWNTLENSELFKDLCMGLLKENELIPAKPHASCIKEGKLNIKDDRFKTFPILKAIKQNDIVYQKDYENLDDYVKNVFINESISSSLAIPIKKEGKAIGGICLCSDRKNYFEGFEIFAQELNNAIAKFEIKRELEQKNEILRFLAQEMPIGIIVFDMDKIYDTNPYTSELLGFDENTLKNMSIFEILSPRHVKDLIEAFNNEKNILIEELILFDSNYKEKIVKGSMFTFVQDNNKKAIISFVDITEGRELLNKLETSQKLLNAILENANFGAFIFKIVDIDNLGIKISYKNRFFELLIDNKDIKRCDDFIKLNEEQKEEIRKAIRELMASEKFHSINISNVRFKSKPDTVLKLNIGRLNEQGDMLCILEDITEESKWIRYFENLSATDQLTGICNRRCLEEKLQEYIELSKRYQRPFSLIMFDIDYFKHINDTLGHDIGDKVLKTLTNIVKQNIRSTDILARYGGEEFIIIAPETTLDQAKILAEKLRISIENTNIENFINITCSFGVAELYSQDTQETFLKRVDESLYKAKRSGRNRVMA